ncbi:alpha/beta hydrolase domain-containing protein, partial [Streptomyces sp. CNQ085]|uniref:alpha/beta hydrolase domain-containing protein n=1 Tax=Streptomyces sp. CNQ085 TaxID=2886944 RepID=UPI0020C7D90E
MAVRTAFRRPAAPSAPSAELGLTRGGIRLSQAEAPTALNTGDNSGETFRVLFGTHIPFDRGRLDRLHPSHAGYVLTFRRAGTRSVLAGYPLPGDTPHNFRKAPASGVGERRPPVIARPAGRTPPPGGPARRRRRRTATAAAAPRGAAPPGRSVVRGTVVAARRIS